MIQFLYLQCIKDTALVQCISTFIPDSCLKYWFQAPSINAINKTGSAKIRSCKSGTAGRKRHDHCLREFLTGAEVMTFVSHCHCIHQIFLWESEGRLEDILCHDKTIDGWENDYTTKEIYSKPKIWSYLLREDSKNMFWQWEEESASYKSYFPASSLLFWEELDYNTPSGQSASWNMIW